MKKSQSIVFAVISFVGALLYRLGGTKHGTLWRDLGVSLCMVVVMCVLGKWHWTIILCMGLLYGSLTTYNKWAGYLLDRKDREVHWESWLVTGLFYGLSMLPYAFASGHWVGFGVRTVLCAVLVCLWSSNIGKAWLEESGRGLIIIGTLPLL